MAQRRKRVFVVGYLGDWRPAAAVLFERDSLCGNPAPSRKKRKDTPTISASSTGVSCVGFNYENEWFVPNQSFSASSIGGYSEGVGTLRANGGDIGGGSENLVVTDKHKANKFNVANKVTAYSIREDAKAKTFSATELEVTTALTSLQPGVQSHHAQTFVTHPIAFGMDGDVEGNITGTLTTREGCIADTAHAIAQPIQEPVIAFSRIDDGRDVTYEQSPTLRCGGNADGVMAVAYSVEAIPISTQNALGRLNGRDDWPLGIGNPGDPAPTLTKAHGHAVAHPMIVHGTQDPCVSDVAFAQGRNNGGENVLVQPMAVRRLTPVECERLQGFPDHYTDIKPKGKPTPDGPRYKALGNSWAVPVARWIGERIKMYEGMK